MEYTKQVATQVNTGEDAPDEQELEALQEKLEAEANA